MEWEFTLTKVRAPTQLKVYPLSIELGRRTSMYKHIFCVVSSLNFVSVSNSSWKFAASLKEYSFTQILTLK